MDVNRKTVGYTMNTNYPKHKELFDVVLMQNGVRDYNAKPVHYKRIPVEAADPLAAQMDKSVLSVVGWHPVCASKPHVLTPMEIAAYRRELESIQTDRSKI